jgi:hypothetical protein
MTKKWKKYNCKNILSYFDQKMHPYFTYLEASFKDVLAKGEDFSSQKRTFGTSKN